MAELLSITHLKPGDKAPTFNALDQDGNKVSSAGLKGQRYALYFYPNDDTETCTKQACNLRDNYAALKKAGLSWNNIDIIELNEAFAAQALACIRQWNLDDRDERINPNGGAIAIGHPLGMSGARIILTAAHQLALTNKQYALCTMCIGVGQGYAVIIERC